MITVTAKDALRAKQLVPGWRPGKVVSYTPKVAGTDGSALYVFGIEVKEDGRDFPLKDFQLSEKAISMGKNFFLACGFPKTEWEKLEKGEEGSTQIDPNALVGKELQVFVANTTFQGKVNNEATDFLAPKQ
jgi:hypothetical protein